MEGFYQPLGMEGFYQPIGIFNESLEVNTIDGAIAIRPGWQKQYITCTAIEEGWYQFDGYKIRRLENLLLVITAKEPDLQLVYKKIGPANMS